jgi:carbon monoxide dehydrogenase subunit G
LLKRGSANVKLTGSYPINAPRETVWGTITAPSSLQGCIPGCQRLEDVGDSNYEAAISASLGPVRGNFSAKVSIKDWNPYESYRMVISASGTPGFVNGEAFITLTEEEGVTTVSVDGDGQAGGLLARVGQRMMESVARNMMDRFFGCLAEAATKS